MRHEESFDLRATAYFKDVSALRVHCAGLHCQALDFRCATQGGTFTIRNIEPATERLIDDRRVDEARSRFEAMRDPIEAMFGDIDSICCAVTLKLPGRIGAARNAARLDDRTVHFQSRAETLLASMDCLIADTYQSEMTQMVKRLRDEMPSLDVLRRIMGEGGPIEVSTEGPIAPSFDYATAVVAAREAWKRARSR